MSAVKKQKKPAQKVEEQEEVETKAPKRKLDQENGKKNGKKEKPQKPVKEDSEPEEEEVKAPAKGKKTPAKADKKKPAKEESESDEENAPMAEAEAEEDDTPIQKKPKTDSAPAKANNGAFGQEFEVLISNCSNEIQDDDVTSVLEGCEITGIKWLIRNGMFSGKGFIKFANQASLDKALEYDGTEIKGQNVSIQVPGTGGKRRDSGPQNPPSKTLFMGGVSDDVTEDQIRELFKECGTIVNIRWGQKEGHFAGFGHVEFESEDGAKEAIKFSGTEMGGRPIRLDFAGERKEGGGGRGGRGGRGGGFGGRGGGFGGRGRGGGGFGGRGGRGRY